MAGIGNSGEYAEKISGFLKEKMESIAMDYGENSNEYRALALQYTKQPEEYVQTKEQNRRQWEADIIVPLDEKIQSLHGMERLYGKTIVVEPTMICSCHCRYCMRGNYDIFTLTKEELRSIANYCGTTGAGSGLEEILITGGDPLTVPDLLDYFIDCLIELAPNVRIIRIATRLITHEPTRIENTFYNMLKKRHSGLRFEIATQLNHAVEFFPETIEAVNRIKEQGAAIYSQSVLLRGVNDNIQTMIDLYNVMRKYDIEPHYLFHCVPLKGMRHLRTTVAEGLELTRAMVNSGELSGRSKPMYALMTDAGKVIPYEDTIIGRDGDYIVLKTNYKYEDRMKWNPSWQLPETASVDAEGFIVIKYLDGEI